MKSHFILESKQILKNQKDAIDLFAFHMTGKTALLLYGRCNALPLTGVPSRNSTDLPILQSMTPSLYFLAIL